MTFILYLLWCFGATYVVVGSSIMAPTRLMLAKRSVWWETFVYCGYCVGFWVGYGTYLVTLSAWPGPWWSPHPWVDATVHGGYVLGAIALLRAFAPSFLIGAWEHEHEIVEALRGGTDAEHGDRVDSA